MTRITPKSLICYYFEIGSNIFLKEFNFHNIKLIASPKLLKKILEDVLSLVDFIYSAVSNVNVVMQIHPNLI